MRNSSTCCKCGSGDILRLDGSDAGDSITAGATIFSSVMVTRYLCVGCGYSEEWVEKPADRAKLVRKYR